jgi:hypothetical protein
LDFLEQKENLAKLIEYAIMDPKSPEDVKMSNRYPFISADILVSSNSIIRAICEGGLEPPKPQPSEEELEEERKKKQAQKAADDKKIESLWDSDDKKDSSDEDDDAEEQEEETTELKEKKVSQVSLKSNIKNSAAKAEDKDETVTTSDDTKDAEEQQEDTKDVEESSLTTKATEEDDKEKETSSEDKEDDKVEKKDGDEEKDGDEDKEKDGDDEKDKDDDDKDDDDDQFERDEDEEANADLENGGISGINAIKIKVNNESPKKKEEKVNDYTLLDKIFSFLDFGNDPFPILCGYFNKLILNLLNKNKNYMLNYLLNEREGIVYDKLLHHLKYYSLSTLMTTLLKLQIVERERRDNMFRIDFDDLYNDDDSDGKDLEDNMTDEQKELKSILDRKKLQVLIKLGQMLSRDNDDYETRLNSFYILKELLDESKQIFQIIERSQLIKPMITFACDIDNINQPEAMAIVQMFFQKMMEYNKNKDDDYKAFVKSVIQPMQHDIIYSCLQVIRAKSFLNDAESSSNATYTNQAGETIFKFGRRRMQALELLKTFLVFVIEHMDWVEDEKISQILKIQVVSCMLSTIKNYPYANVALINCTEILAKFNAEYDNSDAQSFKEYAMDNLRPSNYKHTFDSGKQADKCNNAQII